MILCSDLVSLKATGSPTTQQQSTARSLTEEDVAQIVARVPFILLLCTFLQERI